MSITFEYIPPQSKRGQQWLAFSSIVFAHIENYTVPQYGDFPHDQLTSFSDEIILSHMERYINRAGKGQRGLAEEKRDMLKLIHYASVRYANLSAHNDAQQGEQNND